MIELFSVLFSWLGEEFGVFFLIPLGVCIVLVVFKIIKVILDAIPFI